MINLPRGKNQPPKNICTPEMDGWSARAVPGARRERVSSQFVSRNSFSPRTISVPFPLILISPPFLSRPSSRSSRLVAFLYGAPQCLFVNFLAIERLGEGGARQSTRWMNLRRMQIRASPHEIPALKIKLYAYDNSTTRSTPRQLLAQRAVSACGDSSADR